MPTASSSNSAGSLTATSASCSTSRSPRSRLSRAANRYRASRPARTATSPHPDDVGRYAPMSGVRPAADCSRQQARQEGAVSDNKQCKHCDNPIRYDENLQAWKAAPDFGGPRCPTVGRWGGHEPYGSTQIRVKGGRPQPRQQASCKHCDNPIRYDENLQAWKAAPDFGGPRCPTVGRWGGHEPYDSYLAN